MLSVLLTSTKSYGATTDEKLSACDAALTARTKEANLCDLGVKFYAEQQVTLQKENARLREQSSAWYLNPFVWAAVGVIAGTYIGARATR